MNENHQYYNQLCSKLKMNTRKCAGWREKGGCDDDANKCNNNEICDVLKVTAESIKKYQIGVEEEKEIEA